MFFGDQLIGNQYYCDKFFAVFKYTIFSPRLLNMDGALLAFSGPADRDARVTSAISSNVWAAYSRLGVPASRAQVPQGTPTAPEDKLNAILMDCDVSEILFWNF